MHREEISLWRKSCGCKEVPEGWGVLEQPRLHISCSPKASSSSTSCSLCAPKGQSLLRTQLLLPWQRFSETERGKQAKSLRFTPTQSVPAQARHGWRQRPALRREALGLGFFIPSPLIWLCFPAPAWKVIVEHGAKPMRDECLLGLPLEELLLPQQPPLENTVFLLRAGMSSGRGGGGSSSTSLIALGAAIEEAIAQQPRSNDGLVPEEGAGNDQPLLLGCGMRGILSGAWQRLRFS